MAQENKMVDKEQLIGIINRMGDNVKSVILSVTEECENGDKSMSLALSGKTTDVCENIHHILDKTEGLKGAFFDYELASSIFELNVK